MSRLHILLLLTVNFQQLIPIALANLENGEHSNQTLNINEEVPALHPGGRSPLKRNRDLLEEPSSKTIHEEREGNDAVSGKHEVPVILLDDCGKRPRRMDEEDPCDDELMEISRSSSSLRTPSASGSSGMSLRTRSRSSSPGAALIGSSQRLPSTPPSPGLGVSGISIRSRSLSPSPRMATNIALPRSRSATPLPDTDSEASTNSKKPKQKTEKEYKSETDLKVDPESKFFFLKS